MQHLKGSIVKKFLPRTPPPNPCLSGLHHPLLEVASCAPEWYYHYFPCNNLHTYTYLLFQTPVDAVYELTYINRGVPRLRRDLLTTPDRKSSYMFNSELFSVPFSRDNKDDIVKRWYSLCKIYFRKNAA